ncbi:hypothetical protein ScPMuIL_008916 [Solemya velum]
MTSKSLLKGPLALLSHTSRQICLLVILFTDLVDGGTWCYSLYKYPYRQYCEMGCCGNYMDEYCCVSVGMVVGVVVGIGIMIGVVIAVVCCCIKKKGRVGTVFAPPRSNVTVISTGEYRSPDVTRLKNFTNSGLLFVWSN